MSIDNYKAQIAANVANSAVNQLIADLAAKCVQVDELNAKVVELNQKLNPTPDPQHDA
jgi:hypothetical protein